MTDICTEDNDSEDSIVFDENAPLASYVKKKMNTKEIMRAISAVKAKTIGVYAADHVPKILSPTPIAIVKNLDTSTKPRSYWVAIYIDRNGCGGYCDSYGLAPISTHHLDRPRRNCVRF